MSARKWERGDLVMVGKQRAMYIDNGGYAVLRSDVGGEFPLNHSHIRPLVVIDPEDREQAARLLNAYTSNVQSPYRGEDEPDDWRTDRMRAALRSLIAPPKPDEPTGLGAVVEDADGNLWVNSHRVTAWVNRDRHPRAYTEIVAVKVLSEGVVM